MIFVSSSCVKNNKISSSIEFLAKNGIQNIELSGGTDYYDDFLTELLELKEKFELNYLVHNYFPPPKEHFVLNLASLDEAVFQKSLDFYKESIELAINLGCKKYGLHAGFFVNLKVNEMGMGLKKNKVLNTTLFDKQQSINKFIQGFKTLYNEYANKVTLYIENNSFSDSALNIYGQNPCMLTSYDDYAELKEKINFNLLLDIAHLKVSCNSLNLDFKNEFAKLFKKSDYVHISDNDAKADSNLSLKKDSSLYRLLNQYDFSNKIITLEINESIKEIKTNIDLMKELIK